LGGLDRLKIDAAKEAVGLVANKLDISVTKAALGILEVADAAMERAIRVISIERGYDPRQFSLLAFGGAGPLHAVSVASRLGIRRVIVPAAAGVLSAFGLVAAEIGHDFSQGIVRKLEGCDPGMIASILRQLRDRAQEQLRAEGVRQGEIRFHVSADLRYFGQSHELNVTLFEETARDRERWAIDAQFMQDAASLFHAEHSRRYGHATNDQPVEIVALRVRAVGPSSAVPVVQRLGEDRENGEEFSVDSWFAKDGPLRARVLHRGTLLPGSILDGPAIVYGDDATTLLPPGTTGRVDEYGNLILEIA